MCLGGRELIRCPLGVGGGDRIERDFETQLQSRLRCHRGSFANLPFAGMIGGWLGLTMMRVFALASAARAAGIIGVCWRQRRSSARFPAPAHSRGHLLQRHLSVRGASPTYRPSAAGAQPSLAGERPHRGAGRRRSPAPVESWSKHAT